MKELRIISPAFEEGDWIPKKYSARGEDVSPVLRIENVMDKAVSYVVTLDDTSHPLFPNYNHWIMWNVPVVSSIPEGIPKGPVLTTPFIANQGKAYGKHCYKGPKPPFKTIHQYVYTVYVLDCTVELSKDSMKDRVLIEIEGHILQKGSLMGKFQRRRKEETKRLRRLV